MSNRIYTRRTSKRGGVRRGNKRHAGSEGVLASAWCRLQGEWGPGRWETGGRSTAGRLLLLYIH